MVEGRQGGNVGREEGKESKGEVGGNVREGGRKKGKGGIEKKGGR